MLAIALTTALAVAPTPPLADERVALFRSTCENLRIEVPSGFDALTTES